MNARGQLWSLDVVLAAVVFTLALGIVLSQSELTLFYSQQETQSLSLWDASLFTSNMLVSKPDVIVSSVGQPKNIRCGPAKWSSDNDLSWMENCLIDSSGTISPSFLNVPPGYSVALTGLPNLSGFITAPSSSSSYSFSRTVLILPESFGAKEYRQCMDGLCPASLVPVTLTVWRSS